MTLDIEKSTAPSMWMERWLSEPRLRRYLDVCQGDFARALELYEWNLDLGAVLMKDIAYFEVALRNAYDRIMRERYVEGGNWLFDDQSPVNRELSRKTRSGSVRDANALNRKAIKDALTLGGREASPGSVVAHLPFGFWAHLSDRAHERVLWIPYLQRVWPRGTNRAERFLRVHPLDAIISSNCSKATSAQERAIQDYFAMWVTRDFSRFDELFSPCCRYEECYGPIYEGTEELHRWIEHMLAIQHVMAWDIHDMVFAADGRSVTVAWTFVATERESHTFDGCSVIHFDEQDRIDSIREFEAKHERRFPQRRKEGAGQ